MRSVQSDAYQAFYHAHHCVINSQSRTSCKKCRFEKCLEAGMKVSYVKALQEKCDKIRSQDKKPGEKIHSVEFVEKSSLEELHDAHWESSMAIVFEWYSKHPKAFLENVCQVSIGNIDNLEFLKLMDYMDVIIFQRFAHFMTERDGVLEDSQALVKNNFARMQTFNNFLCFMENWGDTGNILEYGKRNRQSSYDIEQLMHLRDQNHPKVLHFDYDMYFATPWAPSTSIEIEHRAIFDGIVNWYLTVENGSPKLDKCLMILVQLIFLYNSDGMNRLINSQKVKSLQANYSNLLYRYLKSCHEPALANILFGKGLMLIHETQRAHELLQQRLKST